MLQPTSDDRIELLIREINDRFPGSVAEFSTRNFSGHVELWVYVSNRDQYEQIEQFCQSLEQREQATLPPIWLFTKTWTGPWPGGETEQEIKRRREEFRRRHSVA